MTVAVTSGCPSPDRLLAFAAGQLDTAGLGAVEAHIDACTDCRAALSNFARGDVPPCFGRYRIDTVLGSGGMGIVYRAWDPQLARAIAIKVVRRASDDEKGRARLVREAQALARLSHPNVCHVYDVGTEDEEVWVAMELIDGVSLREWPNRETLLDVLLGAARGIAAAHEAGLVHRDIKPENVLVTRDARAIVTDFGLARGEDIIDPNASTLSTDPHLTATGAIAGTPAYIAPEQLTGDPIDARVDQFAFAVMAWELLTGTKPFPIIIALRVDAVRAGVTPPPTLPKHLAVALSKAMASAPRDRFATMRELIEAMETPVRGRARTKTGAGRVIERRSRGPIYASLGLLAMTGAAITAWQWPHRQREQTPPPIIVQKAIVPPPPVDAASVAVTVTADAAVAAIAVQPHKQVAAAAAPIQHEQTRPKMTIPPTTNPVPVVGEGSGSADTTQKMTSEQGSQSIAVQKRHSHSGNERRDAAIATMDAFCYLPYDVAHPDKDLPRPVVDWGKVTSITPETGHLMGDDIDSNILTIKGARGTYRVMQEVGVLNYVVPAQVGDWMALCADREESDIYRFPGGPTLPVESIVPLRSPPRITELAKYKPLHIRELAMTAAGANQHHNLHEDRAYVIRAKVVDLGDGKRLKMDRYWMEVPPSIKLEVGKPTWVVVDHLHYEEPDDSGKKPFVVRAVAVLNGDMFPG
ncbi:MAG: protein kinase [Deltaproteobacteria bacterium]